MGFEQSNIDDLLKEAGLGSGAEDKDSEQPSAQEGAEQTPSSGEAPAAGASESIDDVLGSAGTPAAAPKKESEDFSGAQPASFENFPASAPKGGAGSDIENLLGDVELKVQVVLGNSVMSVEEILHLADGSVIELDKLAGNPLDILVNDRLIAKGEVLVLNENFCIRITDIIPPDERA